MASNDEQEETITIQDAVREKQESEEEAIAVLGAGDEDNCSYAQGYVERQALFSCSTCDPCHERLAGICYGCSLHCHEGHELIELYTKRNFRCDCGNPKFGDFKCILQEIKDDLNEKNKYNQNFNGKYCTCKRPYPDPDDQVEDEMIQCVICEDWYHSRHLGSLPPESYSEMVCDHCVEEKPFISLYKHLQATPMTIMQKSDTSEVIDVESSSENPPSKLPESPIASTEAPSQSNTDNQTCLLKTLRSSQTPEDQYKAVFLVENWREKLCRCEACVKLYEDKNIGFITQRSDTIASYEKLGKENVEKVWEQAANHISEMNHVQKVELMQGYNDLKHGLTDFLKGFKENQVVRKEDVDGFFEELNKRKRIRLETGDGMPPDTCK